MRMCLCERVVILRRVCALAAFLLLTSTCQAQVELDRLGQLQAWDDRARTPGIGGVVFDAQGNAQVLDRVAWTLARVDPANNARVISSVQPTQVPFYVSMGGLAFQPSTGRYYTVGITDAPFLASFDPAAGTVTQLGNRIGVTPSFTSLAFDPAGTLWLASGDNSGELWTVDPVTGQGTRRTRIQFPNTEPFRFSGRVSAIAIDDRNQFVVAATLQDGLERLYQVNPQTGETTLLGLTGLHSLPERGNTGYLTGLAFEPTTHRLIGVENRSGAFYLVNVTGVPEPSAAALLLAGCGLLLRRRRGTVLG